MQTSPDYIAAANALTARWCGEAGSSDFVVSGAGLWPLLGLLAGASEGPARAELQEALGFPAELAHEAALRVVGVLADSVDMSAALGIWVRADVTLRERWSESVPEGVVGALTDQRALDEWADQHTRGHIPAFPLPITPSTLLVLATALAAKTRWRTPFQHDTLTPAGTGGRSRPRSEGCGARRAAGAARHRARSRAR
ncbi:serpin family protein [Nocardia takedensis]|uniref:serpin family protein n=1 Tax=Nocardia takedensis TaxID=259390 RepID=UPI00031333F3|nr:serpin family protein [Nocardia takedensis]